MRRTTLALAMAMTAGALALGYGRDARACGGCFHPPTENVSDITDERMMLAVSPQQSTLYDQIRYSGNPASFAWVLPIHGTVDVGLSADVMFDSIDAITATQIQAPVPACPAPPSDCANSQSNFGGAANAGPSGGGDGVTVTKAENVGPFETVQLHASDSSAINQWLSDNGFVIPPDVTPIIDAYVAEGFDFLAMKLLPNEGVQAMRPVRVTFPGASVTLPLRMAAIGTGATVGITIWTVSDGRYEPQNFPFFHIEDKDLIWDFKTQSSNYTTLRAQNEALYAGKGWEIESSIDVNESTIQSVVESGGIYYGGGGGFGGGGAPVSNADDDYLPIGDADGGADAGAYESSDQVRSDDLAALFAGMSGPNVRITRMRSDISHTAMTNDFTLQASGDQSELSNVRTVTQQINTQCPIYDHCEVVGYGSPDQSAASMQGNSSGGCVTAARNNETDGGLTALLGVVGLVFARKLGSRKKRR